MLAEYSDRAGNARLPTTEEMFTIAGVRALLQKREEDAGGFRQPEEVRLEDLPQHFGFGAMKCPVAPIPALLMSTSSPPKCFCRGFDHRGAIFGLGDVGGDCWHEATDAPGFGRQSIEKFR